MTSFLISTGNVVDGFLFHGDEYGKPFDTHEEAVEAAENSLRGEDWVIVPIQPGKPQEKTGEERFLSVLKDNEIIAQIPTELSDEQAQDIDGLLRNAGIYGEDIEVATTYIIK